MALVVAFIAVASTEHQPLLSSSQIIAIQNIAVIPMDREQILYDQTVLIRGEHIASIDSSRSVTILSEALRIDGTGLYLLPGLMDLHVHFQRSRELNTRFLAMFLASGVTTVLNMRGEPGLLALRAEVEERKLLGPTIFSTGPFIGDEPGTPLTTKPAQVKARVEADKAAGYDFIKLHGNLSRDAFRQLLLTAKEEGLRVVGHLPRNLGIDAGLDGHMDAIAHGEEYLYAYFYFNRPDGDGDDPVPDLAVRTREIARKTAAAGVSVMPNLVLFKQIGQQADDLDPLLQRREVQYLPAIVREQWWRDHNDYVARFKGRSRYFRKRYRIIQELTKALQDAGARLLVGTDTPSPCVVPGFSVRDELENLVESGVTPFQALRAATASASEFLGVESGTITIGRRADLLLLRSNPLDDVCNLSQLEGLILRGRWFSSARLQRMLADSH